MTKKPNQVAQVATSLSEMQKAEKPDVNETPKPEASNGPLGAAHEAYIAQLEAQVAEANRIVKAVVRGKAPPPIKRPRPAGKYRLVSPYWDGRIRHEANDEFTFPEGLAPQSAKYLSKG